MATTTITYEISPRAEKWIRISAVFVMLLVATASLILSFDGLRTLAITAHVPEKLAWLFPLAVDSTILMGSLAVLRMHLGGQKAALGWGTVFFGTALSIAGNVISVKDAGMIAMALHSVPPVLIAISLELLMSLLRVNIKKTHKVIDEDTLESETTVPAPPVLSPAIVQELPVLLEPVQVSPLASEHSTPTVPVQEALPVIQETVLQTPEISVETVESVATQPIVQEDPVNLLLPVAPIDIASIPVEEPIEKFVSPIFESLSEETTANNEPAVIEVPDIVAPDKTAIKAASDANVETYKQIISKLTENASRAKKLAAILRTHPDAKIPDLKKAIGDPANTSYVADIKRVREFLAKKA